MADQADAPIPPKPKEIEVLSDASLVLLARYLGQGNSLDIIVFAMLLNIPTTSIINSILSINNEGFSRASDSQKISMSEKCILLWKELSKDGKTKDRIRTLERALREMEKGDVADTIMERHQQKQELTPDVFAQ
ncbi:hypothetical protein SNE40_015518 [Patella caerulea]|uniref:Death domain-containing protein n=1 Tax=Patella caerulea TaxID=87958 RepID=A0AAN8JNX1_PATCE